MSSRARRYSPFGAARRRAGDELAQPLVAAAMSAASSTILSPSESVSSQPTMSFTFASFAAPWARTTPATEHSSVMASAR